MSKPLIILLGIILIAILGYFCIYKHSPEIQSDIDTRTNAALAEQGLEYIEVDTDGRDIVLTGEVLNETIRQQADEHAKNVPGVRIVDNQLTITAAAPAPEIIIEKESEVEEAIEAPKLEALPEYTCQQEFNTLLDASKINFSTNSAEIDISSTNLLINLIDVANQCPETNIEISGHTDSRGSDDYNLRLSQSRATSVMKYLINNGIDSNRLRAVGYGETNPIADNESDEGLAKNRRIEFNVEGLSQ
ncbi:MAG: OmpA family protein [Gammaproteobacteria bacterium]